MRNDAKARTHAEKIDKETVATSATGNEVLGSVLISPALLTPPNKQTNKSDNILTPLWDHHRSEVGFTGNESRYGLGNLTHNDWHRQHGCMPLRRHALVSSDACLVGKCKFFKSNRRLNPNGSSSNYEMFTSMAIFMHAKHAMVRNSEQQFCGIRLTRR
jgi:hypothetical protein